MNRRAWSTLAVLVFVLLGSGLRVAAALRPGLWGDEIFSLAMTTGHSLEHAPANANPALGDFVEPREASPPSAFRRYAEHEEPPAGVGRVLRAVLLSDTSPPLYYLLLNWWTRAFGTGDATLRLFSVCWAVLSLPLLWLLGRELGGRKVAWSACLLFAFSPVAVYYSTEGRMYSLLGFLVSALGWLTLRLSRAHGGRWMPVLWVLAGAAGLLTHYFFVFVWLACVAWLWLRGRSLHHGRLALLAGVTLLAVLPWYLEVPASLGRWRVTGGWLQGTLPWPQALGRPFLLLGRQLSGRIEPGGWRQADYLVTGLFFLLAIWIATQGLARRIFSSRRLLLWGWLAAAGFGPLVFDIFRHTTTTNFSRYAFTALPAAILLAALAMSQLPPRIHLAFLGTLLLAWLPGSWSTLSSVVPRPGLGQYKRIDARLMAWARPDDLVLVHSIPSGVIGTARYLNRDVRLASWVALLEVRRMPDDLELLLGGCRRVALVKINHLVRAPAEVWLRAHAQLLRREAFDKQFRTEILYFAPSQGDTFFAQEPPKTCGHRSGP